MSQFWNPVVRQLIPYVPGEQPAQTNLVKLNTNENPYPPSPQAVAAIETALAMGGARLRLYPDPDAKPLKAAIAAHFAPHRVSVDQVFVGNGSDEVLAHAFLALLKHELPILTPDIGYSFYPVYCNLYGIDCVKIPLDEKFRINVKDYDRPNGGIILANPNAPTGHLLPVETVGHLAARHPRSVIVIDEAYIDFSGEIPQTAIALLDRCPNLLVVRTLSKSHALAGLRVGYAAGDPALIEALDRVKNSFNSYPLDRLAIAGATAAIGDTAYFEQTRRAVMKSRETLSNQLTNMGFEVLPSASNFIFARHPRRDASQLLLALRERRIFVRHFKQPRIEEFLRITIGTDEECEALVGALQGILDERPR